MILRGLLIIDYVAIMVGITGMTVTLHFLDDDQVDKSLVPRIFHNFFSVGLAFGSFIVGMTIYLVVHKYVKMSSQLILLEHSRHILENFKSGRMITVPAVLASCLVELVGMRFIPFLSYVLISADFLADATLIGTWLFAVPANKRFRV